MVIRNVAKIIHVSSNPFDHYYGSIELKVKSTNKGVEKSKFGKNEKQNIEQHKHHHTYNLLNEIIQIFCVWFKRLVNLYHKRPHKRGLEQKCLPLALTIAMTPAVIPAQSTEDT